MARPAGPRPAEFRRAVKAFGLGVVLGVLLGLFRPAGQRHPARPILK